MKAIRRMAFFFGLFLILVIILADTGWINELLRPAYAIFPNWDKAGHFLLWGILSLLVSLGFSSVRVKLLAVKVLRNSLIVCIPVILEEISQLFFSQRTASFIDLGAGLAGVFLLGEIGAWLRQALLAREMAVAVPEAAKNR